jgi:hypothetical protein
LAVSNRCRYGISNSGCAIEHGELSVLMKVHERVRHLTSSPFGSLTRIVMMLLSR